ncbi:hypothetical protein CR513_22547, partial [Mucuna pruriens]
MVDKGRSDGRRPSNRGRGRGVGRRALATINSPTSIIHISTSRVNNSYCPKRHTSYKPTFIGELIPTIPSVMATTLALEDSLTPKYPSLHVEHPVDQRPFLQTIDKEFTQAHSPFVVISRIIR